VAVAAQVWPLLALATALLVAAGAWFVSSGDRVVLDLAWGFFLVAVVGLMGSYALHEVAHVVVLKRAAGISHLGLERSWLRFSIIPLGDLSHREQALVAAAGPVSCVVVGVVLWSATPLTVVATFYVAHGLLVLPPFGDGRVLVRAARARFAQPHH